MQALMLRAGRLALEQRPRPDPPPGEARVRVLLAGICSTDLQLVAGYMQFSGVPGHEFVGRIEGGARDGELVAGEINAACGECAACHAGLGRHCPRRTVLGILGRDGAFAEELVLPLANLHTLPDRMPLERAVFVEPLAAAFEILEQVGQVAGRRALVLGAGKLGSLCAWVLQRAGAAVTAVARRSAAQAEGRYDLVIEATGSPDGLPEALRRVRPRGTVVLKTTTAAREPLDLAPVVIDEVTIVGSRCGPFEPAIAALAAGELQPERTVGAVFPLERFDDAFAAAASPADPARRKVLFDVRG